MKFKPCDCDDPHNLPKGTTVHLDNDPKDYVVSGLCTRGRAGQDYTQLTYAIIDPDMVGGDQWPVVWVHHSEIRVPADV